MPSLVANPAPGFPPLRLAALRGRRLALTAVLGAGLAPGLWAQQTTYRSADGMQEREIQGSIPVAAVTQLRVVSEVGNVGVRATGGVTLTYDIRIRVHSGPEARAELDAWPISVRRSGDAIVVAAGGGPRHGGGGVRIALNVPAAVRQVTLHTAVGNISATGLSGELRAVSAAGNIAADRIAGPVIVATAAGNVNLGSLGGSVRAGTAGGNITLASGGADVNLESQGGNLDVGRAAGAVRAVTAGGSIRIESAGGNVIAETAGGNIVLGQIAGAVRSETSGGNIQVAGAAGVQCQSGGGNLQLRRVAGPVRATTEAGTILARIAAKSGQFGDSLLESGGGDITVYLPAALPVTVRVNIANAFGHRLFSDFPQLQAQAQPDQGELSAAAALNGGGPLLRLISSSSNITVHKEP